ncbi:N-acetyl-alpha-D-glucosaminyl L-malate synthase BshA [Carboxydothermus pertinax]|uniref:N-acetyl-alpha-D-glucosaminyl L-malate synthase BshA n=1 Tax=Carboxydothermus pertinax TaxID=870242 RepID=A0A1L8CW15_9THEO|nr:N-acetyl-alpha-D-glucosaminyl L-malate synthase BshA [Carboxydothermus pertinax]GAV23081.1 N-acetyl-alpha-D-glucosaminyl L-malate synthase BshA [Carboxydothermus pertinax]
MKVGIVCYPGYGGSGVVASELGKALATKGIEVHFICFERPFRLEGFEEGVYYHEVEPVDYPLFKLPLYYLPLAGKIIEVVRTYNLDLIHAHYAIPHTISALTAKEILAQEGKKIGVVTTLHGTDVTLVGQRRELYDITRWCLQKSDGLTAVSSFLKEETSNIFNLTPDAIEVIYNFIDLNEYRPEVVGQSLKLKLGIKKKQKVITHISNFRPVKRPMDVLKIFEKLLEKIDGVLLLVGEGPETGLILNEVQNKKLGGRVKFLGKLPKVKEVLNITDVLLITSETESFGLVALEAMAMEVPVVAYRVGGLPEVVINGENGFLVDFKNIDEAVAATEKLLLNPELKIKFGQKGRLRAKEKFNLEIQVNRYLNYYEKVLKVV